MIYKKLGTICSILNGYAFKSDKYSQNGYRVIRITNVQKGIIVDDNPKFYSIEEMAALKKYELYEKDILISLTGNVGRVGVIDKSLLPAALNQRVACLRLKNESVNFRYLFYWLSSDKFENSCIYNSKGIAQKNLSAEFLEDVLIPIPPLETQKKIVEALDQAQSLIDARKEQIRLMDELVKSKFIEMFGDPFLNPMDWKQSTLKNVSKRLSDGPFGSNLKSEHYRNNGVRVIRLQNIGDGVFIDKDQAYISHEHYKKINKYTCYSGDVLIGTLGEPNLRACILPDYIEKAINKADCVHYVPDKNRINQEFVCQYINSPEVIHFIADKIHGQTRSRISSGQVAQIPIYLPPIQLQNQFASFKQQVNFSKQKIQNSLKELNTTQQALMQQYFR